MTAHDHLAQGRRVFEIEMAALQKLHTHLDEQFTAACDKILACQGRVVVTGMGKSGHIGGKIAATLASTGTPAFFVHPGEASHGDLGMITKLDCVLALSNSGETDEVIRLIPVLKRRGIALIAMTGQPQSTLAKHADIHIAVAVDEEACPLGLAPTASTTAALAMGDALAVSLLHARGFTADDFALSHPGGSLGRRLLLRTSDIMHTGERIPQVNAQASISSALLEMSQKGLGMTAVVGDTGQLLGIFTDGDLRRILDQQINIHDTAIAQVMTRNCLTAHEQTLVAEAVQMMESKKINGLLVVNDQQHLVGAFNMHDVLSAGVL